MCLIWTCVQERFGLRRPWMSLRGWHIVPLGDPCRPNCAVTLIRRSPHGPASSSMTTVRARSDSINDQTLMRLCLVCPLPRLLLLWSHPIKRTWMLERSSYAWATLSSSRKCWMGKTRATISAVCRGCWWVTDSEKHWINWSPATLSLGSPVLYHSRLEALLAVWLQPWWLSSCVVPSHRARTL